MKPALPPDASEGEYFNLASVHAELRARSIRSGLIAAAGRVVQGVVALGSIAVLARLLQPSDFGVIAMVIPISTVASMTLNNGLHVATLHEEQITTRQVSVLFWKALRFNIVLLGTMALSAPLLARFYGDPRVKVVALIWAASLAVQSIGAFPEALLKRQLRFGVVTMLHVMGIVAGAAVAIVAAAAGAGYVALILQIVTWDAVRGVGAVVVCRWRPERQGAAGARDDAVKRLVSYGANFALYRAVYWAGRQADRLLVGYVSGAGALGLYDGARRWSWYPFHELFQSLTDVVVASLSRARADVERFRQYCRHGMMAFLAVPLPLVAFVFVEAQSAVLVLLGPRWVAAVPLVRIMCGAVFFDALSRLTLWLYTAEGRTRQSFRWSLVQTPVMLAAVLLGATRGVTGVAWAFAGATALLAIPTVAFCLRGSMLRWSDFAAIVWRPMTASIGAAVVFTMARDLAPTVELLLTEFLLHALMYGLLYIALWLAIPGGARVARMLARDVRASLVTGGL